jgi:hypothetical protein
MNIHKSNLFPPLRKGRIGGDDNSRKLPVNFLQIINSLLRGHPLLLLPFPRGGYQLPSGKSTLTLPRRGSVDVGQGRIGRKAVIFVLIESKS